MIAWLVQLLLVLLLAVSAAFAALPARAPERPRTTAKIIQLPQLRPDQWQIASHPAKVKVICMGRRWGKSIMCGAIAISTAAAGGRVAWVVPEYSNGRPLWRFAESSVRGLGKGVRVNRSERIIEFPNGGFLALYSAASPDSILGNAFHLVIIDEAARIAEEVYTDIILPTLADFDGDIILISTPKRKNWFYREWVAAAADGVYAKAWTAPTSDNPMPSIQKVFAIMRGKLTERTFGQEWLAEFLGDGGDVFHNVAASVVAEKQDRRVANHGYVFGMDLAKYEDYSVIAVWDTTERALVNVVRFPHEDYVVQLKRLQELYALFQPSQIVIERNIGEMFIEQAIRVGLPILPFLTTAATKLKVIEDLDFGFEKGYAKIINDAILISELESYTTVRTPSGTLRYGAPAGMHDDTVIAACLGYHALGRSPAWEDMLV